MKKKYAVCSFEKNYAVLREKIKESPTPLIPYVGIWQTDFTKLSEIPSRLKI